MTEKNTMVCECQAPVCLPAPSLPIPIVHILGIVLFGFLSAVGKKATMDLGISGHSALLWLTVMVAGRALIHRDGVGLALGVSTALWGIPAGFNHTLLHNIGLYGATGMALDLVARSSWINLRNPFGAMFGGACAHMVKFAFILGKATVSSTAKRFVMIGILQSATLHLVFGMVAGLAGFGIWCLFKPRPIESAATPD